MSRSQSKKRIQFSLHGDSETQDFHQRIEHHDKDGETKVTESDTPISGSTTVSVTTNPYEKRTEQEPDGGKKKVDILYSSDEKVKRTKKSRNIEELYNTSEL
jgi:hypothetical protein